MSSQSQFLVSIVVPVYKVEAFLTECIESIINQTYTNLEIILVDDGSPDLCPQICDNYANKDSRIQVIHKTNGGLSDARNAGIDIAKGDWITFVDSDDFIDVTMIETLVNNIRDGVSVSCCGYCDFTDELPLVSRQCDVEYCDFDTFSLKPLNVTAWAKLYKLELFENLRYPVGRLHEDEFTTYKLLDGEKIAYTSVQLYYYRQRPGSIVTNITERNMIDEADAYLERAAYFYDKNNYYQCGFALKIACNILLDELNHKSVTKSTKSLYKSKIKQFDLRKLNFKQRITVFLKLNMPRTMSFLLKVKRKIKGT